MKTNKPNNYKEILGLLLELKQSHPSYSMGRHLSTALADYGDLWDVSDKEIVYALEKYMATMEMDVPHETDDKELEKIIRDGMSLSLDIEE